MCREKQRLYHHPRNWEAFKTYQRATVVALRSARLENIRGMLNYGLGSGDHKPFWQYLKSQHQDNCGVSPLKRNGELHSDSKDKAQILNDQFSSVFTKDDQHAGTVLEGPSLPPLAGQVSWWLVAGFWYLQCSSNGDAVALHWDINTDTMGAAVM